MAVKTIKTYSIYKTSDGRIFDDKTEANDWESLLGNFTNVVMLDKDFNKITDYNTDKAIYVYIKTTDAINAFNKIQKYRGNCSVGSIVNRWHYYDVDKHKYIDIFYEMTRLSAIGQNLDNYL